MPAGSDPATALADFEAGRVDPKTFRHRQHVRIAFQLLERHPFPEALLHLARGLRALAAKAGRPEAYHETVTTACLALIAERRLRSEYLDAEDFLSRNPDLLQKNLLNDLYGPAQLASVAARKTFILPRRESPND